VAARDRASQREEQGEAKRWFTVLLAPIRDAEGGGVRRSGARFASRYARIAGFLHRPSLASRLHCMLLVKATEFDDDALVERIALAIGDCLGAGSLSRHTGALTAYFPCTAHWARVLSKAKAGTGWAFPGVRLGPVAALINAISAGRDRETQLELMSFAARGSRIVFQRCPWNLGEVLFVVLPDDAAVTTNFVLLRSVLESVRRDVGMVRGPRVEARFWN
jgi:hypothetical protein